MWLFDDFEFFHLPIISIDEDVVEAPHVAQQSSGHDFAAGQFVDTWWSSGSEFSNGGAVSAVARLISDTDFLPSDSEGNGRRRDSNDDDGAMIMSSSEDGGEIVVLGYRIEYGGAGSGGEGPINPEDPATSIPRPEDEMEPEPDCAETNARIFPGVTLDAEEREKLETIGDAVEDLLDRIGALPAGETFGSASGSAAAGELFELLVRADFVITNRDYGNETEAFGSMGAAIRNGGDPKFSLNEAGVVGWGRSAEYASYYILHELARVTLAGDALRAAGTTDAAKVASEQWAHSMALILYTALFGSPPPFGEPPGPGYSAQTFQRTASTDPAGETAEQAYDGCGAA